MSPEDEKAIRARKKATEELAEFTRTLGSASLGLAGLGSLSPTGPGGSKSAGGFLNDATVAIRAFSAAASTTAAALRETNPLLAEFAEGVGGDLRQLGKGPANIASAMQATTSAFSAFQVAGVPISDQALRSYFDAEFAKNRAITSLEARVQGIGIQSSGQLVMRGVGDAARGALALGGSSL